MPFQMCLLRQDQTLRDGLASLNRSGLEIVLIVGDEDRLTGILTDGDVRRALLDGVGLDDGLAPHMKRDFTYVTPRSGRAEVLDIMQARGISQIPILDEHRRLVGLHTLREVLGASERPNWAVVMAGGRGERLRPLTDALPKPMIKVAGRPILERIVLHLVSHGVRRIFLSINYMGEMIERHFGDGAALGCRIEYLKEEKPLGTGGALSLLPEKPQHPILVLNGDLLTQVDFGSMLSFHAEGGFGMTVGIHEYVHEVPYGVVETEGCRVLEVREKPSQTWLANAGIYALAPALMDRVPKETHFPLPALIEECLEKGEPVGAFRIEEDWIDVGHHQELKRARGEGDRP